METVRRLIVALGTLAAGLGMLTAQEPARVAGHVLLLQSDRGLEGDIEKIGEQFRIRRGTSEVWLSPDKVARLCADWEDAYAFMKTRANLGDPDERLRLSRWCQLNNLKEQALIEAKVALDMRPGHAESRHLVTMLTRALASLPSTPVKLPVARPGKVAVTAPGRDISSDSMALFTTRVQPILMNTCVQCHSGGRAGHFDLVRTEGGERSAAQANLASVLDQVNMDNPALSALLIKAVSPHGNAASAPIKNRQAIPFTMLQTWIEQLLANNPHLRNQENEAAKAPSGPVAFAQTQALSPLRPTTAAKPLAQPELAKSAAVPAKLPPLQEATPLRPPTKESAPSAGSFAAEPASPSPAAVVATEPSAPQGSPLDPYDPAIFNKKMHPGK